jgi:hypothetical protein
VGRLLGVLKVDAVLLNGGGIVAFYPTEVPYHHRSQFLGTRDLFGELVAAMKRRSIRAVARVDCNLAYEDALKAHPEWFERKELALTAGFACTVPGCNWFIFLFR